MPNQPPYFFPYPGFIQKIAGVSYKISRNIPLHFLEKKDTMSIERSLLQAVRYDALFSDFGWDPFVLQKTDGYSVNSLFFTKKGEALMEVFVCIGSSCHLRGSYDIINALKKCISDHGLEDQVNLNGSFCLGKCTNGVTIKVDDQLITGVSTDNVSEIFDQYILGGAGNGNS